MHSSRCKKLLQTLSDSQNRRIWSQYSADLTRWGCGLKVLLDILQIVSKMPPPLQNLPDFRELVLHRQTSVRDKKTYLDIAGDEISRLRYVLNEKVKCKVPIWADEKLIDGWNSHDDGKSTFGKFRKKQQLFIGPYRNLTLLFFIWNIAQSRDLVPNYIQTNF